MTWAEVIRDIVGECNGVYSQIDVRVTAHLRAAAGLSWGDERLLQDWPQQTVSRAAC